MTRGLLPGVIVFLCLQDGVAGIGLGVMIMTLLTVTVTVTLTDLVAGGC